MADPPDINRWMILSRVHWRWLDFQPPKNHQVLHARRGEDPMGWHRFIGRQTASVRRYNSQHLWTYVEAAARSASEVAKLTANFKAEKYHDLTGQHTFLPIAFEIHGVINSSACKIFRDLSQGINHVSGDNMESYFQFQHLSMADQRFNAVLFSNSFLQHTILDL